MTSFGLAQEPNLYTGLKSLIEEKRLLDKQPMYYMYKIIFALALFALSIYFVLTIDAFWVQWALIAPLWAFTRAQIGFVGHDSGHRIICRSLRRNQVIDVCAAFLMSLSKIWWINQHNQHHRSPNNLDEDPHTLIPILAFSTEKALEKTGILRSIVRYQAYYFLPMLLLEGIGLRLSGPIYLWKRRNISGLLMDVLPMTLHFLLYFGLLLYALDWWQVLIFAAVDQGLFGLYYGSIFAPNHKGELIIDETNSDLDFFRMQVLTSRSVEFATGWVELDLVLNDTLSFIFGGLNWQPAHHLFTSMPQKNLQLASYYLREWCESNGITYSRANPWVALWEVLKYLDEVVTPLKQRPGQISNSAQQAT